MGGKRRKLQIDFTDANEPRHDVAIVIDDGVVHASKQILSTHSPVFKDMFDRVFAGKNEIELEGFHCKEFIEMLNLIYSSYVKITKNNVMSILEIADRFKVKKIIDVVEEFVLKWSKMTDIAKLLLSDQYGLDKLQERCLLKLRSIADIEKLKTTCEYEEFSVYLKTLIEGKESEMRIV